MPSEEKSVKKEEVEDEEDEKSLGSMLKDKRNPNNGSAEARTKTAKVKKEPKTEDDDDDDAFISKKKLKKPEKDIKKKKKKKQEEEEKKAAAAEENAKKREKKVFDLPGQKRDPPEERDPLRIFYETLYQQLPDSEMAAFWMMESGLLPKEEAKKLYEKKLKRNHQQKLNSPTKVLTVNITKQSVTVKKTSSPAPASLVVKKTAESKSVSKQSKKRKIRDSESEDEEDDFVPEKKTTKKPRAT